MYMKSILAVAVTMAATGAMAQTITLNNQPITVAAQYTSALTWVGEQSGNLDPATLSGTQILGDFTNEATISAKGDTSVGLGVFNVSLGNGYQEANNFSGDLINKGKITAEGAQSQGMLITQEQTNFAHYGSLSNEDSGSIVATGEGSKGLHLAGVTLTGELLNDGVISGTAVGLDLDASADGILITNLRGIDNAGSIIATGADSRALVVDGASFYLYEEAIGNTGTIKGGAIGIDLENVYKSDLVNGLVVNTKPLAEIGENLQINAERGLISGGQYAIYGGQHKVDLNLGNTEGRGVSTIEGNLDGIGLTNVIGPAVITGSSIDSQQVRLNSGSILTLDSPNTTMTGDLAVLSGSTLGLPLSADTKTNVPVLSVAGNATLETGSNVVINAKGSDFAKGGVTYELISASSLSMGSDVNIKSSSALLTVDSVDANSGKLNVKVSTVGSDEAGDVVEHGGGNVNTQRATQSFMSVAERLATSNPNDPVLKAFLAAGTDTKAIASLAKKLSPEVNNGAASATSASVGLVNRAISNRAGELRSGQSSGEGIAGTGMWLQALGGDANQDVRSGIEGYDAHSRGFAVGADRKLNDNTTVGLAYSYVKTNVDSDTHNKTDVENHTLTAYGSWTEGNYFVDGSLSYGKGRNESKRYIVDTATADYDSNVLGLDVLAGYGFKFQNNLLVEPRIATRYTNVGIDSYHEKDSSAALSVGKQRVEVGELGAGVRVATAFNIGSGSLEPEIKAMAYHDFIGDKSNSTSAFVLGGDSFVTTGATPARDTYELGLGAKYKLGAVTLSGGYERQMKTGFDADSFTARVRYDF